MSKYPYLFRRLDSGELVEVRLTPRQFWNRIDTGGMIRLDDGSLAKRDWQAERERDGSTGRLVTTGNQWKNYESIALGCHPEQVGEFRQFVRERGLTGVEVLDNGRVKVSTRGQRAKLARACGMCDNDGGYSD